MAASVHELIGQIINPQPGAAGPAAPLSAMAVDAPVDVLIGRIMAPPGTVVGLQASITPPSGVPGLVAELVQPADPDASAQQPEPPLTA